jgi:hypothetical protein
LFGGNFRTVPVIFGVLGNCNVSSAIQASWNLMDKEMKEEIYTFFCGFIVFE